MIPTESEDCLFLNVYTPLTTGGNRAVIVFIHGGGYNSGFGDDDLYGSQYFMTEDVVVVTFNYRLGVLGFFSTGDRAAAGNWALKDCIVALRWVQDHIAAFGGDASNVTIYGESAGAAIIHLLLISPLTGGLFHRAIASSGSPFNSWAFQPNPLFYANRLAETLDLETTDTTDMVAALRLVPYRALIEQQEDISSTAHLLGTVDFGPVVEPPDAPGSIVLPRTPMELVKDGAYQAVPLLTGFNNLESVLYIALANFIPNLFDSFNAHPHYLVPRAWNISEGSPAANAISNAFAQFYWQGQTLGPELLEEFSWYLTDLMFAIGVVEMAELQSTRAPVYVYHFTYDGDLNLFKQQLGVSIPGAVHADEVFYLFDAKSLVSGPLAATSHARTVRQRMLRLWTNFAKYGNPTPVVDAVLQDILWPELDGGTINVVLNIDHDLMLGPNPIAFRYDLWQTLEHRYANRNTRH
ncbi:juvenile hormone esterase-like [Anopheles cruzii]|uniref:juvenile hormone esterase-like n=1 Tax=Anopheles cruzii TaxID=68878 RepID=UPI0022EC3DF8|nr:juvenile hormone esterase-like [Anopheles cruzii]